MHDASQRRFCLVCALGRRAVFFFFFSK